MKITESAMGAETIHFWGQCFMADIEYLSLDLTISVG
jgi:hypothetical protein